jgi:hypothetical protein
MPSSKRAQLRVRTVGLVSSIVAVAALGLTLLADNGSFGFGGSVTRSQWFSYSVSRLRSSSFT